MAYVLMDTSFLERSYDVHRESPCGARRHKYMQSESAIKPRSNRTAKVLQIFLCTTEWQRTYKNAKATREKARSIKLVDKLR